MFSFCRCLGTGLLSVLLFSVVLIGTPVQSPAADEEAIAFRWAFGAIKAGDNTKSIVPITRDMTLQSGDQLKMMVEPESPCYVYVIYHNFQDGLELLFPYSLQQFASSYEMHKRYYIPQGEGWFKLDENPGRETFHLLASPKRLESLEGLLSEYQAAEAGKKPEIAQRVLSEIRSLKKQQREFAASAERPVAIGGAIRGLEPSQGGGAPDVAGIAEEVQSTGFVARAFSIEHQ